MAILMDTIEMTLTCQIPYGNVTASLPKHTSYFIVDKTTKSNLSAPAINSTPLGEKASARLVRVILSGLSPSSKVGHVSI